MRSPVTTDGSKTSLKEAMDSSPRFQTQAERSWFEAGLVFLVFLVVGGDHAPMVNEAHYLCRLKHYWDPAFCAGDLFLESPDAHFTVVWLFGWVTKFLSLETTAWVGRLLSWGLLAIGWQRLIGRITTTPFMAPLAAALLAYGIAASQFAGEWLIGGFEAKSLAYGFVLLALADAIEGRWNRAWLGLGVASALHALVGGWSVIALAVAWSFSKPRAPFASMLPGLIGGGLLALAGVVPALLLNTEATAEQVHEANNIYVYFRLPHHLALLTKQWSWIAEHGIPHAVAVGLLAWLTKTRATGDRPALRLVVRYAWAAEAISLVGLVIGAVEPDWSASILKYYLHRLADIATPLAIAIVVVQWLGEGLAARRRVAALAAVCLVGLAGWHLTTVTMKRLDKPFPPGCRGMLDPPAWMAMCEWIRENTESDGVFLTPQRAQTFKWHAQRAEVVTRKDIPQDALSMIEWRRRISDIYQTGAWQNGTPRWTRSIASLGAVRLREVAETYGADYALDQAPKREAATPLRRRASLPILHRVGPYTLYDLRRAAKSPPAGGVSDTDGGVPAEPASKPKSASEKPPTIASE